MSVNPRRFLGLALLLGAYVASAPAADQPKHVVLVGDSTVTDLSGWGLGFRQFAGEGLKVSNAARNGTSSKSYRDEGRWTEALALKGDYYLIQFGHNDQPGKGPARETDPTTTYTENLARFVDEVRAQGAQPVLVTSLVRRTFSKTDPTRLDSAHGPYVEAVKRLAAAKQVPLVDLHARSLAFCEDLGPERTATFNFPDAAGKNDTTHLDARGSAVFARLVAEELRQALPELAPALREDPHAALLSDLTYGTAAGEKLLLDVSVPAGEGPFPVAILVHGGGWSGGDKATADGGAGIGPWFGPLTAAKYTWFSINYRLAPQHRWPACLDDVLTAIRWVKANAAKFNGDPARIALFGHSAGGHLVCLAATVPDDSVRVEAVVGFAPVTNHEQELPRRGGLSPSLQKLLDRPKEITPESLGLLRAISPLNHVRPGLPPFLLIHGDADQTVPIQQSHDFQAALQAHGVECDLMVLPGAAHGLAPWAQGDPGYIDRYLGWLAGHLQPAASAPPVTP
ncbi:Rhamnogalacturonan acetylesterase RhgT [Lacunisphaera limnophila]|uniref:Rhamnogalacturonan acetylesterase RhgT n=1 Tax=Lacunisphaera limnophila TaxID=1838286 RepID=A0A1D8AUE2_9BACT|nr:Rhamnogalacturonan acetylesterase RhgT [Lacunisphaera limnophila]